MSNTDSFIEEVTEEVRRDRLFRLMRRYGWIAVLAILVLVGGATWNEWRKAQERARAEALGDALVAAMENDAPADRMEALSGVEAGAEAGALVALMRAAEAQRAGNPEAAAATLAAVASDEAAPALYRDLAVLKRVMILGDDMDAEERRAALESIAAPGAPFRLLAEEQLALAEIDAGETGAAIERLRAIAADAGATAGLRNRASQLIVALGGEPGAAG